VEDRAPSRVPGGTYERSELVTVRTSPTGRKNLNEMKILTPRESSGGAFVRTRKGCETIS